MVTESYLQHKKIIKWSKFYKTKFPTPFSTFQYYLENPASIIACFPFYSLLFSCQTSGDTTLVVIAISYELIKYNQFQISENKSDETPYVML